MARGAGRGSPLAEDGAAEGAGVTAPLSGRLGLISFQAEGVRFEPGDVIHLGDVELVVTSTTLVDVWAPGPYTVELDLANSPEERREREGGRP